MGSDWAVECLRNEETEPGMFVSPQGMLAESGGEGNRSVVEGGGGRGSAPLHKGT